jgi:hypothetical protein
VLWGTAIAACLLFGSILSTTKVPVIASASRLTVIDPNKRTVTTNNFLVAWSTGTDTEAIISINWRGGQNLTSTEAVGNCNPFAPGAVEYFGDTYAPPDPQSGGFVLVGGGTTTPPGTTAWSGQILSSGTAEVTINSSSTGCPPSSAGINVKTTYNFFNPDDPNTNWFGVQRAFDFTPTTFAHDFRPYMPRLSLSEGFTQVLYPTTSGSLATLSVYNCPIGCTGPIGAPGAAPLNPPWDATQGWFAIHNPGDLQGVVVKRDPSNDPQGNAIAAQLWVDNDGGSDTNASSFLLMSPTGGFTAGLVTEVERLCFYDSTIWTPSLTPPAACSNSPVSLSPSTLTFAPQAIGTTSASKSVTLTNTSDAPLSISNIAITGINSGDFAQTNDCPVSPGTVAPAGFCTLSVTFTPTATGIRTGAVTITDNAVGSPHQLPLTGTGGVPVVSLTPSSLSFASQAVGSTSPPQPATLKNAGDGPLSIASITTAGDFAQTNNCGSTVNAGASCTLMVTFTPSAAGRRAGALSITDDAAGSPHQVSLTGTGFLAGPAVSLIPTSLTFAAQTVGTSSPTQLATLKNTGGATLKIISIGRSGDFYEGNNCPTSLVAGSSCTVRVTFTPTSAGPRSGAVTIADNAPGSPHKLPLSGTGSGTGSIVLMLSPASLSFGSVAVGATSASQTVTLTNTGTVAASFLEPFGFATSGTNWSDFHKNPHCGTSLAPGKSCTVSVFFKPLATGTRTGLFLVRQGAASKQVPLSGRGQ